ncbi:MAG: helix-turn-helix domain-containing protein [Christensenellaceae bacterium]|nr:helix-turn-helix domain-containing protein [Christensenellaceae bacterium]
MYPSNDKIIAVPPGATIKEQLEIRKITLEEFAKLMGMSEQLASDLIDGKVDLTPSIAIRLQRIWGISYEFWMNLETGYRDSLALINRTN